MVYAIGGLLVGAVLLWLLYLVRGVLLLMYVSTLLAIGSPRRSTGSNGGA